MGLKYILNIDKNSSLFLQIAGWEITEYIRS